MSGDYLKDLVDPDGFPIPLGVALFRFWSAVVVGVWLGWWLA